ncbi:MAG TPA: hypothetical protein VFN48_09800 [Solirubrobacteraceae bacterium]|nr:hypothetical protein [Solirubrobacteraceae bacterium]
MPSRKPSDPPTSIDELLTAMPVEHLRELLGWSAQWHEDVENRIRLAAARSSGDLSELRIAVDRSLRTRRFLGYRESMEWARQARPVLIELEAVADTAPSQELVDLLQRGISHVVKVLQTRADDSSGLVGDLARDLLALHAQVCDQGVADPVKLAKWMIRFRFTEQDYFEADPVRYRTALGEHGLASYRALLAEQDDHDDSFAVRYARQRLAVLDGNVDEIVLLLGGDLSRPAQFIQLAEAMEELGRDDHAISWARRGIAETAGWQVDQLYDLACRAHIRRGEPTEALALRRSQHEHTPSSGTYRQLRTAAEYLDAWPLERDAARRALRERNPTGLVDALLADGDGERAWRTASALPESVLDDRTWVRLAEAREPAAPEEAVGVYWRLIHSTLQTADRRAYASAIRLLKRARDAATAAERQDEFNARMLALLEQHRRRPSFIAMLTKAKLIPEEPSS